jgi:shikimate dehydrogenase
VITGSTKVAAVIGWPIEHSLSPALHNAAFASTGQDWVYVALPVQPESTSTAIDAIRTLGLAGVSVTMPHKTAMAELLDHVSPAAVALRSVNTVVRRPDGVLEGHSTDGEGFIASLVEATGETPRDRRVVVFGAGGAGRAVVHALGAVGAAGVTVVNRTAASAATAADLAGTRGHVASTSAEIARALRDADVVVNATSVGMGSDESPVDVTLLRAGQVVADLVYHPLDTALLAAARNAGCTVVDGLGMLIHQAALQQQLWTGVLPDTTVMRAAAHAELARRG